MQRIDTISTAVEFRIFARRFTNWALCFPRLRLWEYSWHCKYRPKMDGAMVCVPMVFSGTVWVAWTPTPLRKETLQINFRAETRQWTMQACLENLGLCAFFQGQHSRMRVDLEWRTSHQNWAVVLADEIRGIIVLPLNWDLYSVHFLWYCVIAS